MKTILAVDDEVAVLECFQMALSRAGYRVLTTSHPGEALDVAEAEKVDLLMLDVRMPKISGLEIYKKLKAKGGNTIPVLFVTAYPTSFSIESAPMVKMWETEFSQGDTDILYKPCDIEALVEKVEGLIGPAKDCESEQ